MKNIIIFKNDRIGDLFHSLNGINLILNEHKNDKITIYLSSYSKDFSFLFLKENIDVKILNYRLNFFEKVVDFVKGLVNRGHVLVILCKVLVWVFSTVLHDYFPSHTSPARPPSTVLMAVTNPSGSGALRFSR